MALTSRQQRYFMTIQQLIIDADKHWEVLIVGMYMRDPTVTTKVNPMWQITCWVMNTDHTDYDRVLFPHSIQAEMTARQVNDRNSTPNQIP